MKIIIADDHPIVLEGIFGFLFSKNYNVLCTFTNGIEVWNSLHRLKPNLLLLDYNMPGMTGMELAEKVRKEGLDIKIVLLTMHKEKALLDKAKAIGINGYLLKDFALQELDICLQTIKNGSNYYSKQLSKHILADDTAQQPTDEDDKLTPTERKILKIIASQKTSQEIADSLFISLKTVEKHRSNIIKKLGLSHAPSSLTIWAVKNVK